MSRPAFTLLAAALLSIAACDGTVNDTGGRRPAEGEDEDEDEDGPKLPVNASTWTYTDVDGAVCGDGSPVGVATNGGTSSRLVIYLAGGGACWNALTCNNGFADFVKTGITSSEKSLITNNSRGIFDRRAGNNPFATDSFAYVPYCTGDLHAGTNPSTSHGVQHVGGNNIALMLPMILRSFPDVTEVLLAGTSAGGYGALLNAENVKAAIDDDGVEFSVLLDSAIPLPPFAGGEAFLSEQLASWAPPLCATCTNLQTIYEDARIGLPGTRIGMTMTTADATLRQFFTTNGVPITATAWESAVSAFVESHVDADFATFIERSEKHVFVFDADLEATVIDGVSLADFYAGVVGDSAFVSAAE